MTLSQDILHQMLARCYRYYPRVDSTNDIAKSWLLDGAPDGAVVVADEQLRGRGRQEREWHTPPDVALALSIILRPKAEYVSRVNMIGALSVSDLATHVGCDEVGIKWPNDVQVNGKKASGILVENVWARDRLLGVVLGIGVNVRVDFAATEIQDLAISLEDVTRARLDRAELIRKLLERIDHWNQLIATNDVFQAWKKRLNTLGNCVTIDGATGIAVDVTEAGALMVETEEAGIHQVYAGDVFVIAKGRSAK